MPTQISSDYFANVVIQLPNTKSLILRILHDIFDFRPVSNEGQLDNLKHEIKIMRVIGNSPTAHPPTPGGNTAMNSHYEQHPQQPQMAQSSTTGCGSVPQVQVRSKLADFQVPNLMIGSAYPVTLVSVTSFRSFGVQLKAQAGNFQQLKNALAHHFGNPNYAAALKLRENDVKAGWLRSKLLSH